MTKMALSQLLKLTQWTEHMLNLNYWSFFNRTFNEVHK